MRPRGYPLVVVLLAHANPLFLMCPVESPQFCVELGPKSLILPLLKLHQLLLPMVVAGGWVPGLMGVVKALPKGLTGVLMARAYCCSVRSFCWVRPVHCWAWASLKRSMLA